MINVLNSDYVSLYIVLSIFSLLFSYFKKENLFIIISIICLILLTANRPLNIGADTKEYERIFLYPNFYISEVEQGYLFLVHLSKSFGFDYRAFLLLNSSIIFIGFGSFILTNKQNKIASFFILFSMFFLPSMNLMRQWLSMAIGIFAFNNKRLISLDLFIVFLAVSFHITGLIFLLIILPKYFSKSFFSLIILSFSIFLLMLLDNNFIELIKVYLPNSFYRYFTDPYFFGNGLLSFKTIFFLFLFLILSFLSRIYSLRFNHLFSGNNYKVIFLSTAFLSFVFSYIGQNFYMIHRFGYTINLYYMLSIPAILSILFKNKFVVEISTIIIMFVILLVNLISDNNRVFDYNFLLQIFN
jgi:hypothetical protein